MVTDPSTRKLSRLLADHGQRLHNLETIPQGPHTSIDNYGIPVYDKDGNLMARQGRQADGTWGSRPLAGPTPPIPNGVTATGAGGAVEVTWSGGLAGKTPLDFEALEILADGGLVGSIHDSSGGTLSIPLAPGDYEITARSRSQVPVVSDQVIVGAVTVTAGAGIIGEKLGEAQARIDAAEADLEQKRLALEEAERQRKAAQERLNTLETKTIQDLREAQAEAQAALQAALVRIQSAETDVAEATGRLDAAEGALGTLDRRVTEAAVQTSRGPLPPRSAPLGAQWLTPEGFLYVRVPCEEVA